MATKKSIKKTWIKPLNLEDDELYGNTGDGLAERAVAVQLSNGNRLDIWLESNGSLYMVPNTPRTEILVTPRWDGDGFEVRVEKIR